MSRPCSALEGVRAAVVAEILPSCQLESQSAPRDELQMPLSAQQRAHLEGRLKEERVLALELINRNTQDLAGSTDQDQSGSTSRMPFHPADLGTDTIDEEMNASNATRVSNELAEIDAALERLYSNPESFGVCEETGRDIPFERLDIIPWARTCGEM